MSTSLDQLHRAIRRPCRCVARALAVWACCASIVSFAYGASDDLPFLDGLRARQLYSLAQRYCRDLLARDDLPAARRADLTMELSRCLADEALQATGEAREELWHSATDVVEQFFKDHANHPRLVQLRVQRALVLLAAAEQLLEDQDVSQQREARIAAARAKLREAIEGLREAAEKVAAALRKMPAGRNASDAQAGELSAAELRSLEKNIQYQTARALRHQGESYSVESPDRINSLTQAVELLRTLAQGDAADPLTWPSRLDAAACYRLLGHLEAAERRLDQFDEAEAPPVETLRARAERIRLMLAQGQVPQAVALAEKPRQTNGRPVADLDYAALEAYLSAWRAAVDANDSARATKWQAQAADTVAAIERTQGPYWRRRAESLFAEQVAASPGTKDISTLVRAAESFYLAGHIDEALATYDRAIVEARSAGNLTRSFELGYAAGAIEQERKHFTAAAQRFRQAAIAAPQESKAPEAHLLAIYDLAQEVRAAADTAKAGEQYAALLREHLTTWPTAKTADRAHLWMARLAERGQDWQQAVAELSAVRPGTDAAQDAAQALAQAHTALLAKLQAQGKPTNVAAQQAVQQLLTASEINTTKSPQWTARQLEDALAISRLLLEFTDDGFSAAARLLDEGLRNENASAAWRAAAQAQLIYALAAQGRSEEATEHLSALGDAEPAALASLIGSLEQLCQKAKPDVRRNLATLALQVIALLDADPTATAERRRDLALQQVRALAFAGRPDESLAMLRTLALANPRDGTVQEALATALTDVRAPEALAAWQNIESKSRSGSDRWFRAKLQQALFYEQQGDRLRAGQTVNVVRTLYPGLGGGDLQRQFQDVHERCK